MTEETQSESAVVERPARAVAQRKPMKLGEQGFEFDFEGAWRFAQGLIEAGMVPRGVDKPGAVLGIMQAAREMGLPTMYGLANLTMTNGRIGIMGDAAKALIRRSGMLEPGTDFVETFTGEPDTEGRTCTVSAHRAGQREPFSRSFSLRDAERAGIAKATPQGVKSRKGREWTDYGPWTTYTDRMLCYRATGFLARDYFGDVLCGAVFTEELADYPAHARPALREITPPAEADPLLGEAVTEDATVTDMEFTLAPEND